jgi:hypothetical protein
MTQGYDLGSGEKLNPDHANQYGRQHELEDGHVLHLSVVEEIKAPKNIPILEP